MNKANKLGQQAYQDFLKDSLPSYAYQVDPIVKDQYYWTKKDSFFQNQKQSYEQTTPMLTQEQISKNKIQSKERLNRNLVRRQLLQEKSQQKCKKISLSVNNPESLIVNYHPVHLHNGIDNIWNHLELTDEKHLNFIYGPKTFQRQKRAISYIKDNTVADYELLEKKEQLKFTFRQNQLSTISSRRPTNSTTYSNPFQGKLILPKPSDTRHFLISSITPLDEHNSKVLFKHCKKHVLIDTERGLKTLKSLESPRIITQQSDPQDINDQITLFEKSFKNKCDLLEKPLYYQF
ncbi:hypothetical protein pb186bvf_013682 [Paramecium bursaria]